MSMSPLQASADFALPPLPSRARPWQKKLSAPYASRMFSHVVNCFTLCVFLAGSTSMPSGDKPSSLLKGDAPFCKPRGWDGGGGGVQGFPGFAFLLTVAQLFVAFHAA